MMIAAVPSLLQRVAGTGTNGVQVLQFIDVGKTVYVIYL